MDSEFLAVYYVVLLISMIIFVIYRIYLGKTVETVLILKKIENSKTWGIFTVIFGLFVVLLCFIINRTVGEPIDEKKSLIKKYLINAIVFGVISVALIPLEEHVNNNFIAYKSIMMLGYDKVLYFDEENNEYFCYDKQGNVYTTDNIDEFKYYDSKGDSYVESSQEMGYYCTKRDITIEYGCACIDESGNIVELESEFHEFSIGDYCIVYYDDEGNLYYYPDDCSWDKNGNLVFGDTELSEFKYEDI